MWVAFGVVTVMITIMATAISAVEARKAVVRRVSMAAADSTAAEEGIDENFHIHKRHSHVG
jgi:hypothetical protein